MNPRYALFVLAFGTCLVACAHAPDTPAAATATVGAALPVLSADASVESIADHVMAAQNALTATHSLAELIPSIDRETAYAVQLETLARRMDGGSVVRGWKMGGTRIADSSASPDPLFGYSLDSHVFDPDRPLPADAFVGGAPDVEAEITLHIGADLPGPTVSRDELIAAVSGVGGAVEVLSKRLAPYPADAPSSLTPNHLVADNVSHGGVMLGEVRVPVEEFDFDAETAVMRINGAEAATGVSSEIMGTQGTALDAVLWLANELPKHGLHLKAGDYVVTGSLYANPSVRPGDHAELVFSTLGTIAFDVE